MTDVVLPRIKSLRLRMGWAQSGMAAFLGLTQASISNMENSANEHGSSSRLLDALEAAVVAGEIEPGVPPEGALIVVTARAQGFDAGGASSPSSGVAAGVEAGHA